MNGAVRTARPRVPAIVSVVVGAFATIAALLALANASAEGALLGGGLVAAVVAVLSFLLAGYGFQLGRSAAAKLPAAGPLTLLALLTAVVGVIGSMGVFVLSAASGSQNGMAVAVIVLVLSFIETIVGFRLVRVSRQD